jgi:hypothetical protein
VSGVATEASGANFGVYGTTLSSTGRGVQGFAPTTSGTNYGVYGHSNSTAGRGVFGSAPYIGVFGSAFATSGINYGVHGSSSSTAGRGVRGEATSGTGTNWGVYGSTASTLGYGVAGYVIPTGGLGVGVYGYSNTSLSYAVFSDGNFAASGTKSFQIDHPTDPANKYLNHYCTEGPQPLNVYSGNVRLDGAGNATVELPAYFEEINKEFRYQLTPIGAPAPNLHVAQKIRNNSFRIGGGQPGIEVSWRVEAVRNDRWVRQHGAPVEVEKSGERRGKYLQPELHGVSKEMGIHFVEHTVRDAQLHHESPDIPTMEDDDR